MALKKALAHVSAIFSPTQTPQTTNRRIVPKRNAPKIKDKDFYYPSQSQKPQRTQTKHSSIDLGSTISDDELLAHGSITHHVPDSLPVLEGDNSLYITSQSQSQHVVPESQDLEITTSPGRSKSASSMFSALSDTDVTLSGKHSKSIMAITDNTREHSDHVDPDRSTPVCSTPVSAVTSQSRANSMSPLLVTESQLPSSPTVSQELSNTLKMLICANAKNAELQAELIKLKDELNIEKIRGNSDVNNSYGKPLGLKIPRLQKTQNTQTDPICQTTEREMALFRSDGHLSVLSNFHYFTFRYNGINYISTEQAYQHRMAQFHKCNDTAHRIMKARTSAHAKKLAKSVTKSDHWHECKTEIMTDILMAKANQCAHFKSALLQTGNKRLIHNIDTDSFWGCGPDLKGVNMMGVLLEELRNTLRVKTITAPKESQRPQPKPNPAVPSKPQTVPQTRTMTNNVKNNARKTPVQPKRQNPPPSHSVLVIGNSNARQMSNLLAQQGVNAESYCYPGGPLHYITSRIRLTVGNADPTISS